MQKKFSRLFILLANIIILVHTALPFHHCHHLGNRHQHSSYSAACKMEEEWKDFVSGRIFHLNHRHDNCSDDCQVSESFKLFTLAREKSFKANSFHCTGEPGGPLFLFATILSSSPLSDALSGTGDCTTSFTPAEGIFSYLLDFLVRSVGMRAPNIA